MEDKPIPANQLFDCKYHKVSWNNLQAISVTDYDKWEVYESEEDQIKAIQSHANQYSFSFSVPAINFDLDDKAARKLGKLLKKFRLPRKMKKALKKLGEDPLNFQELTIDLNTHYFQLRMNGTENKWERKAKRSVYKGLRAYCKYIWPDLNLDNNAQ